jgi:hypothetical protein
VSTVRVHPAIVLADSVTHYVCEPGEALTNVPDTTHHINALGRCRYCHRTLSSLRAEQEVARG